MTAGASLAPSTPCAESLRRRTPVRAVRLEDEVAQAVGHEPAAASHDRLQDVRMRADHGVGSGTQRGGREGALARVLARRPLEAQWKLAMTTSPLRRARRTPASIRTGVAGWVPALSGPAKNELGRMSEKPTNAILRPSRSTTCARAAAARSAPAPTGVMPKRRTLRTVSSRAEVPQSPAWLLARFEDVEPGVAGHDAQRRRPATEGEPLRHRGAAPGDGTLEVAEGDVGAAQARRRARPWEAQAAQGHRGAGPVA
jgi:hypothetical protein